MAPDTDDLISGFQALKISALSKSILLNDQIKDVTIGPNRTILLEDSVIDAPGSTSTPVKKTSKTTSERKSLSPPNAGNSAVKKFISDLEKQRQEGVQKRILCRKNVFDEFSRREELGRKEQWLRQQQKMVEALQQQESLIFDALEQYDRNVSNQHQQLVQYYQDLAEKQKKNAEELEEREKRNAQINAIIESIKKDQTEFRLTYQDIAALLKTHATDETLKGYLPEISNQLSVLPKKMTQIVTCCKSGQITDNEAKKASETLVQLKSLKEQIEKIVTYSQGLKEEAAKAQKELEQQQEKEAALQKMQQEQKQHENAAVTPPLMDNSTTSAPSASESVQTAPSVIEKYCSRANLKQLSELQEFLNTYRQSYKQFAEDGSLKQYKFDLKKAVNIPVNAISAVNARHLLDKYERLHNLLAGRLVIVGDAQIVATKHPQAIAFCMDLVAEKFVLQGDLLISSNPEAAFNYAAVIVALWNDFPDFGKLVLAHFYEVCPYLVPWYAPRTADQTTEDYYKSQGYKYIDGVPEKQDKFLKRMTGIMRLYSAIFITKPKRGQNKNPHGINEAWRWIASILNLDPRLDITATMIHVFLETVGSSMQTVYGKVFQKLMRFIREKYMPMVEKIDSGGPFTRLCLLFDNYAEKHILEPPSGMLPNGFW